MKFVFIYYDIFMDIFFSYQLCDNLLNSVLLLTAVIAVCFQCLESNSGQLHNMISIFLKQVSLRPWFLGQFPPCYIFERVDRFYTFVASRRCCTAS